MSRERVTLVTGAANGIGREVALRSAAHGPVVLADIDEAALGKLGADLRATGAAVMAQLVDVTDVAQTARTVQTVRSEYGRVDVLVNNAGGVWTLARDGRIARRFRMFGETAPAEWPWIIGLNLMGTLNCTHAALPSMIERGAGRIVNVSSVAGVSGSEGLAVYSAAKGGVIAFTKALSREVARHSITVNSVAPSAVDTRVWQDDPAKAEEKARAIPMGRLAAPGEIADAVMYFASDAAAFVTGQILTVSGGPG